MLRFRGNEAGNVEYLATQFIKLCKTLTTALENKKLIELLNKFNVLRIVIDL